MSILFLDHETYSSVDLLAAGVYAYSEAPDFEILMTAWAVDDSPVQVAIGEDEARAIPGLWDPDVLKVAHNAQFERITCSRLAGLPVGEYLDPEDWHDTQALAGVWGYPQKLENLALALGGEKKDTAGTRLINIFSKPDRNGKRTMPEERPEDWAAFVEYCRQDVVTLRDVYHRLDPWPTEAERQAFLADQRCNDLGIEVDVELARLAHAAAEDNTFLNELEFTKLSGVRKPKSVPQMKAWVEREGLTELLPNMQADTIMEALKADLTLLQRGVLELRQELALAASSKYKAALAGVSSDGRLRGQFRYFGAHTGRWSGRGVQLQNLPRLHVEDKQAERIAKLSVDLGEMTKTEAEAYVRHKEDVRTEALITDLHLGNGASSETLKRLIRPMLYARGVVIDYSQIEARVLAWLADEHWVLDSFAAGKDLYVVNADLMSAQLGGKIFTRAHGKVAELALGYNGGVNSLRAMGAEGEDAELQLLVDGWRGIRPRTVAFWRLLGDAVNSPGRVGRHLRVSRSSGGRMHLHLPSGRAIVYHGVRWDNYVVEDKKTGKRTLKESYRYNDPRKPGMRIGTYGGRLTENATQAAARDLLAAALVRLQREGYRVVGHVHDELLVEGTTDVAAVAEIVRQVPRWAKGLPVDADGFYTERYRKG